MKEIWKPIKDFIDYFISNFGRVKSTKFGKERILKPCTNNYGYLHVVLRKNNKQKNFYVHRLVAEAFIPNPHNYPCVNHKDENPLNNNVENLEWCTASYNSNYGTRNERLSKKVYQYTKDNKLIKIWKNACEAEREEGFRRAHICACCLGKRKSCGGFIWRYK